MDDFLYLFRGGNVDELFANADLMQAHMQKWKRWMENLAAQGHLESGRPLAQEGKVLRGPEQIVTDGPFAEGKEVVAGYLIIRADDLSQAEKIARGCPILADGGSVEVRPINPM